MPGDLSPAFFGKFVWGQLFGNLPLTTSSFAGKTVIITGSNTGLGQEAARRIVQLGVSKLIIAVRSLDKGEAAKKDIEKTTRCHSSVIEVWHLDLCSYASVKAFAARATKDLQRVDVLLENAGVAMLRWVEAEGYELSLTVNVISTFLLALLMLPKLRETATKYNTTPILSFVVSDTHFFVDFHEASAPEGIFNHMNKNVKVNWDERYPTSKLMEVFCVRELASKRTADQPAITINMVNPGLCESELSREGNARIKIMKFFLARSTEKGSRTLVNGTVSGPETHGEYLNMCKVTPTASVTQGQQGQKIQKKLWGELMEKLETIEPGISGNL